jgi:hypothetical protein
MLISYYYFTFFPIFFSSLSQDAITALYITSRRLRNTSSAHWTYRKNMEGSQSGRLSSDEKQQEVEEE